MLSKFPYNVIYFRKAGSLWLPGHLDVRYESFGAQVDRDLQAFVTHNTLIFAEHPVEIFWRKELPAFPRNIDLVSYNFEVEGVNCLNYEISDLLLV